jgi:hypothetical protein
MQIDNAFSDEEPNHEKHFATTVKEVLWNEYFHARLFYRGDSAFCRLPAVYGSIGAVCRA